MQSAVPYEENGGSAAEIGEHALSDSGVAPASRESFLLWCIGSVFGAGMIALLVAMCVAEVSIQRGMAGENRQPDAPHVSLSASR